MNFLKKITFWTLLTLPFLALLGTGTPASSMHIQGDQALTLPLEPTASTLGEAEYLSIGAHYQTERRFLSNVYKADQNFELLGLNWEQALPEGTSAAIEIHFRTTKGVWTDWQSLQEDNDHPDGDEDLWTYVITEESEAFQYRVFLATEDTSITPKLSNISFDAVDGGESSILSQFQKLIFKNDNEVQTRKDWGANEEMLLRRYYDNDVEPESDKDKEEYVETDKDLKIVRTVTGDEDGNPYLWEQQYPKDVKKIVVHHTATSGSLKNPEESIRAIYYYHAVTRGWGDIGYNYVIAPDGTVYQGRAGEEGVVAGHASGYNTGTIGIALLGNYQENPVPGDMMQALTALIYEKAELHDIDVDGKSKYRGVNMENLLGHRDVSSTACPGQYSYDYLEDIRKVVASSLNEDEETGDFAYEETTDRELVLMDRKDQATILIRIKNTGDKTWNDDTYLVVNADTEADKIITIPKDSKKHTAEMKESSVAPGKTATFSFTVKSTDVGGLAHFEATPVFNGEEKIDQYMDLGFYVEVEKKTTTNTSSDDDEEEEEEDNEENVIRDEYDDLTFEPGEKKYVWVQVKNISDKNWTSKGSKPFTLALTTPKGVEVSKATAAFQTLKPGASSRVYFSITAPDEAGDYDISVRPRLGSSNLTTKAYTLNITVASTEEGFEVTDYKNPIRIKLTPDNEVGSPIVTSTASFALYDDEELLKVFEENSRAKVTSNNGNFSVSSGSNKWTVTGAVRFVPEDDGIMKVVTMDQKASWDTSINDNKFRGTIEVTEVDDEVILINELPLEDYLKGMAEETNDTPEEKLKTMAILARSYAYYYITQAEKFPGMPYDGEDDPATFQKYLGYGYELRHPNVAAAAEETAGTVVTYKGTVIKTPYFSKSDGVATKSAKDVWGWTNTPYLVSVPDTYCKSTAFSGHGVGLSGCGAKALAEKGWLFEKIIKYYYTGVELGEIE